TTRPSSAGARSPGTVMWWYAPIATPSHGTTPGSGSRYGKPPTVGWRSSTATSWWRAILCCLRVHGSPPVLQPTRHELLQGETKSPASTLAAPEVEERPLAVYEAFSLGRVGE